MPRALFEKTGNAIYISHLDLMRIFQRSFKRAGLPLTHTKGYNPRPSVSIALPLSLGVESCCELLDFDLEGESVPCDQIMERLNKTLTDGIRVLDVYENGVKLKELAFLSCRIVMEYDKGIPEASESRINTLFDLPEIVVEKKGKNGITEQNIAPMIQSLDVEAISDTELQINAKICCQNPSLNPAQLVAAVSKYLPDLTPDFSRIARTEMYNNKNEIFR